MAVRLGFGCGSRRSGEWRARLAGQGEFGALTASADPAPPVGAHRHFMLIDGEKVYIGPNFCDVDAAQHGFAQFHARVHVTDPGAVDVKSEGC